MPRRAEHLIDAVRTRAAGDRAERAAQHERREHVGLGDADLLALRGGGQFRTADIGATADQVSRDTDRDIARRRRNRLWAVQQGVQRSGCHAQQHPKRVLALLQLRCQLRNGGLGLGQHVLRLVNVETCARAAMEAVGGDLQRLLLLDDVLLRDLNLLLQGSDADVLVATSPTNVTKTSS